MGWFRSVGYLNNDNVEIISRNNTPFTEKYYPVTEALKELDISAVFDGEIVAVNEKGLAKFQLLQNWQNTPSELQYYIFDLIWLDGYDLTRLPLIERKKLLRNILPAHSDILKYSDHVIGKGKQFFKVAVSKGLEGIMAKKASSVYTINARTEDWVKIKVNLRQEVVIAGYTQPRNTRKFFGSLLLGVYKEDELVYVGHTGSGFNAKSLEQIYNRLQPLKTESSPFAKTPRTNTPATWVKPKLVCEIKFSEWTKEWIVRQAIFMGLRVDKKAKDVTFEKAKNMTALSKGSKAKNANASSIKKASKKAGSITSQKKR